MMERNISTALKVVLLTLWFCCGANPLCEVNAGLTKHPVSLVEAEIYVTKKKLVMRLTCFAEDLELLQGVEPYEDGKYDNKELEDGTNDHAEYLLEKILIMDATGEPLQGKVTEIRGFEIPEEGIDSGQLMKYNMNYVIEYRLDAAPESITIQQNMTADGALLPTELKILMKQAGSDTPFIHMMKPDQPEVFPFDWENLPLGQDASSEDWEAWFEVQREKKLGIESYSSLYDFVYITKREVRQEVLIPIASLATFIDIETRDERFLEIDEQDALVPKIKALLSAANPVTVDQRAVEPTFDRIDFYGLDIRDFAMQSERRKVSTANGRVGIIMSYLSGGAPSNVTVTWDMFNEIVRSVDVIVLSFDEIHRTQFTKFVANNTFSWANAEPDSAEAIKEVLADFDLPYWRRAPWLSILLFGGAICVFLAGLFKDLQWQRSMQSKAGSDRRSKRRRKWSLHRWFAGSSGTKTRRKRRRRSSGHGEKSSSVARDVSTTKSVATRRYVNSGVLTSLALLLLPLVKVDLYAPWHRPLRLSEENTGEVFEKLHGNLFKAFDYADEANIYDGLAKTIKGPLLSELYLELNDSLRVKEQGGAVAVITDVELVEGELSARAGEFSAGAESRFVYRCKWNLVGTIEHWGHIHERTNTYDADFDVEAIERRWKITGMRMNDAPQGFTKRKLRKF